MGAYIIYALDEQIRMHATNKLNHDLGNLGFGRFRQEISLRKYVRCLYDCLPKTQVQDHVHSDRGSTSPR